MNNVILFIATIMLAGCAAQKTTQTATAPADSVAMQHTAVNEEATTHNQDPSGRQPPIVADTLNADFPACIKKLVAVFAAEEKKNPRRRITRYTYKGSTVYYVRAICCDFYSDLYDADCNLIGHPDGGFTGKGDGKIVDFLREATNAKFIWEDKRP